MNYKILLLIGLLGSVPVIASEPKTLPTTYFTAYVLPVGREDRIAVRRLGPRDLAELSLLSSDQNTGRFVEDIQWSSDRSFLVFSTGSVGGHSPWNHRTYVFSTKHWKFLCLDDVIAPIVSENITFKDASHLSVNILKDMNSASENTEERIVDLSSIGWKKVKYPHKDNDPSSSVSK